MKLTYLSLLLCLTAACTSPEGEPGVDPETKETVADALHIDFQSGFYQDTIALFHGREKIYERVLTSAEDNRLTDKFTIPKSKIQDTLYFQVSQQGRVLKGHIPPNADQYIGIYLTQGTAVNIYSKDTPFEYN